MRKSKPHTSTDCACQPCQDWEASLTVKSSVDYILTVLDAATIGEASAPNPASSCIKREQFTDYEPPSSTDFVVERIINEQRLLDASRSQMADEIVEGYNPKTLEDAKNFARNWIVTAAQYASDAEYYRQERDKLQAQITEHALKLPG